MPPPLRSVDALRRLRLERNLELVDVARLTRIDEARLRAIEVDPAELFYPEATKIAAAYGLTLEQLADELYGSSPTDGA